MSLALQLSKKSNIEAISSTIIIIGFVIGLFVVPLTLVSYVIVLIRQKRLPVPLWLVIANIIFLFILMLYLIFINVEGNHSS